MRYFIHYNHDNLEDAKIGVEKQKEKFKPHFKPYGLWACDIMAKRDWGDWCESEQYATGDINKRFIFTLKDDTRMMVANDVNDFAKYVSKDHQSSIEPQSFGWDWDIDYAKLMEDYDGIEITEKLLSDILVSPLHTPPFLHVYSVPSICVWNLDKVEIARSDPEFLQQQLDKYTIPFIEEISSGGLSADKMEKLDQIQVFREMVHKMGRKIEIYGYGESE